MKIGFRILLCCLAAGPLSAAAVSYEDCLRLAVSNNPSLRKAEENLGASRSRLWQAWAAFLPTAGASAGLTHLSEEPPTVDFSQLFGPDPKPPQIAGNPLLQYSFQDNWSAGYRVALPLSTGGRNLAQLSLARADLRLNEAMVRSERAKLDVDLVRAYYGVAVNRTLVELAGRTIEQLDRKCRTMSNFLAVGSATELDVMRARVMRSSWGVNLASMTRAYEANLSRLSALTGLAKSDLVVTNTLIPLPAPLAESVAEARTRALASRPELVMAENSSRIAEASRRIRASGLFPQASASWNGYWSAKKETPALSGNDWKTWWDLRLSVTWEFFNLGRWAELDQSRHEVNARAEDLQASRDRIAAEAEDAWRGLDEARKSWEASEQNLELARMTARTASSRKKSGAITETEELESLLGETEASVQKLRSEYDLAVAYAEFNRATGRE